MTLSKERKHQLLAKAERYAGNASDARLISYLGSRGLTPQVAEMFMLGFVPYGDEYEGRMSIPYVTPTGVVQIKYRALDGSDPKYIHEAGCGTHLYNARVLIHAADTVVLTEGELDAITVQAYCGIPAVAYPGTETWAKQEHYKYCFEGVTEVVVVADGDKVGRESARRVAESIGFKARVLNMPDGLDSNSFIAQFGAQEFINKMAA